MGLKDLARIDWKKITGSKSQWADDITLTSPTLQTALITNLHTKHYLSVNELGVLVNGKNAHVSFSESQVTDANPLYVLRNAKGEVHMAGHKVTVKDSTGLDKTYVIQQWHQNETLGVIVCILGAYA
jgi:hypothetical protein